MIYDPDNPYDTGRKVPSVKSQPTSVESARRTEREGRHVHCRQEIHQFIKSRGTYGATCDEVESFLGYLHQTTSSRIRELTQDKFLIDSGQTRLTRSRHKAVVWIDRPERVEIQRTFFYESERRTA